jgi:DNA-binding HxlR family transcriptional regulator
MLIQTLKLLEKNNFIKRKDYKTIPPKVVYSIKSE